MTTDRLALRPRRTAYHNRRAAHALATARLAGPRLDYAEGATAATYADDTGAPLILVRTPYRVGRIVGSFYTGHHSGGPEHDRTARAHAAQEHIPGTPRILGRWDAASGASVSLYAMRPTA